MLYGFDKQAASACTWTWFVLFLATWPLLITSCDDNGENRPEQAESPDGEAEESLRAGTGPAGDGTAKVPDMRSEGVQQTPVTIPGRSYLISGVGSARFRVLRYKQVIGIVQHIALASLRADGTVEDLSSMIVGGERRPPGSWLDADFSLHVLGTLFAEDFATVSEAIEAIQAKTLTPVSESTCWRIPDEPDPRWILYTEPADSQASRPG